MVQIVEHDANSTVLLEVAKRKEAGKYAERLDTNEAYCQKKIQQVKGQQLPPVRQLTHWITLNVIPLRILAKGEIRFKVINFEAFSASLSIYLNGKICRLIRVDRDVICIEQNGALKDNGPNRIQQRKEICDEKELHGAFAQYWARFWNRDDADDPDAWDRLSQHISAFPMHQLIDSIDMTDIACWKQTRAEMKTHSSQGVCGWSVPDLKMLSDRIVQDLITILARYEDGWPEWIMISRVTMLAKREDCVEENHTRPITVTSLLWRWWASTLARQVLAKWANTLPPSVKGGVPNSSVQDLAMQTHLAIERAHAGGTPVAGFTLDITKCFNCIPRRPTGMLFSRLGIPENLIKIWFGSLMRLTRVIDIGGNLPQPIWATTGLPEGCPVSVLGMAAIAWAFAISIQHPQLQIYTFYDNWSWISSVMEVNQATIEKTIHFCALFRLSIDFGKSWAWGTTAELRRTWGKILSESLDEDNKVQIVLQATDLGIVSHFAKTHGLLKSGERIESGIRRLKNLTHIKSTIDVVGHLVQTVIWPHALFGAEFMPLGYEHFERLRTKLTEVLMRRPKSGASPWISCNVLIERMQDPEEYFHTRVVQNARRYLVRTQDCEREAFHRELHEHEGNFMNIHGPVGVLKRTLTRIGWTTTPEGQTFTDRMVRINLAETPWPLVRKLLQKSWLKVVTQKAAHRKETAGDRNFNRAETAKTIARLPVELRHTACLQIAGGYQSETRKAQWLPDHEGLCPMCGKSAPFRHILFECGKMQEDYEVEGKSDLPCAQDDPIWRVPITREHESVPAKELLQFTPTPVTFAEIQTEIEPECINLFTDGSGEYQTDPDARLSTWSVVMCRGSIEECVEKFRQARCARKIPNCFQILATAQSSGEQTVPRAELEAVVNALEAYPGATVYTDCESVVKIWDKAKLEAGNRLTNQCCNADLVKRLHKVILCPGQKVIKVKAHVDPFSCTDDWTGFLQLGNQIADEAAKAAMRAVPGDLAGAARKIFASNKAERVKNLRRY